MKQLVICFMLLVLGGWCCNNVSGNAYTANTETTADSAALMLKMHIDKMAAFTATHRGFNRQVAFLVDMRRPSGSFRFFVTDISAGKILFNGLVAHGAGSEKNEQGIMKFSNQSESYCSSLGVYSVGVPYAGRFGKAYKLHGLDTSNNNAFKRLIVLHSYSCVPDAEQAEPICNSLGCLMVSPAFLTQLSKTIDKSKQRIAIDVYY